MHTLILMNEAFASWDTGKIRFVLTGGANSDPALLTKIKEAYPNAAVINLYGLSEVSGGMVMSPKDCDFDTIVRSIGKTVGNFEAKELFVGRDEFAYQVIPPRDQHVNIHPNVLHLWSCLDGSPLPDFTRGTGSL